MATLYKKRNGEKRPLSEEEVKALQAFWNSEKAELARVKKTTGYRRARAKSYPHLADQLDAIWKHFLYYRDTLNQPLHPETNRMLEKILAVKAQYSKPKTER